MSLESGDARASRGVSASASTSPAVLRAPLRLLRLRHRRRRGATSTPPTSTRSCSRELELSAATRSPTRARDRLPRRRDADASPSPGARAGCSRRCRRAGEVTVEANPETVTPELARRLREAGVTRVSLGAQTFRRELLEVLERGAGPDDVRRAVHTFVMPASTTSRSTSSTASRARAPPTSTPTSPTRSRSRPSTSPATSSRRSRARASRTPTGTSSSARPRRWRATSSASSRRLTGAGYRWYETANFCRGDGARPPRAPQPRLLARARLPRRRDRRGVDGRGRAAAEHAELAALPRSGGAATGELEPLDDETRARERAACSGFGSTSRSPLGGSRHALDPRRPRARRRSSASPSRDDATLALTERGRFLGGAVTAELLAGANNSAANDELRTDDSARSCGASSRSTSRPASPSARRRSSSGPSSRLALDRAHRARRARGARPAHASAHLRRARPDRERLPLLRRRAARPARPAAAPASRSTCTRRAPSSRPRCRRRPRCSSQVTRLLALVSAPPLEATTIVRVEVLLLQPQLVMVVVITSTGGVTKRLFALRRAGRPRARGWAREYLNETVAGLQLGTALLRRRLDDPSLAAARARVPRRAAAGLHRARLGGRSASTSAARPASSATCARDELEAYRSLLEILESRAALLELLGDASSTSPARRARRRRARASGAARGRARRRGLRRSPPRARLGQPARPGADGLREGDPRGSRGRRRALALRRVRLRGRPATLEADGDDRARLLRAARRRARRDDAEIKRAFRRLARELHPDVSDAPDAEERFREVVEAYEVLSKTETRELYDRYGHEGLRSGGFEPGHFDLGNLSDLFSAFFGDDLARRRARGRRAAPTSPPRSRSSSSRRRTGIDARGPVRGRRRVRALRRQRRRAGHARSRRARPAAAPAGCSRCRAASSASSCARRRARPATAPAARSRLRAPSATAPGACSRSGRSTSRSPPGIHDGQRIRLSGGGPRGRARRAGRRRLRRACTCGPTRASCARATTSSRPST